jgi:D-arabinose 1-dehydrogenase-like Zn-dependent alcohol dehydrogenase
VLTRITHLLRYEIDGTPAADAVVEVAPGASAEPPPGRLFAPGVLPCGECPACRRGLVAIWPARRPLLEAAGSTADPIDVPDRFLTPLDDPPGLAALTSETALLAGPVAFALQALALASAAPGDAAIWLGGDPLARIGARVAAARGLKSFLLVAVGDPPLAAEGVAASADPGALAEAVAAAETPAGGHAARSQRHLIATRSGSATWAVATRLAAPGGTLTFLGPGPLRLPAADVIWAEDPQNMLDGIVRDLQTQLVEAKRQVEVSIADEQRLKKQLNDALAKAALGGKQEHESQIGEYTKQWDLQKLAVDKLKDQLRALNDKIDEARRKMNVPVAPARPGGAQLPEELRLLRTGAYHPDLIPESLALLRRELADFKYHLKSAAESLFTLG